MIGAAALAVGSRSNVADSTTPTAGTGRLRETSGLGEIDTKPVESALAAAGHLGRSVTQLLLYIALVDFGRGGEAGPQ